MTSRASTTLRSPSGPAAAMASVAWATSSHHHEAGREGATVILPGAASAVLVDPAGSRVMSGSGEPPGAMVVTQRVPSSARPQTAAGMTSSAAREPTKGSAPKATAPEPGTRSEEHTSELQSLMRISYAVFCLKKKKKEKQQTH